MFTKHMLEVCKGESTLLVNSLTGAMDEINTDELNKIKTGERNSTYDLLKRRGYLEEDQTQIKEKVIQYCQKCVSNFTNRLNLLLCLTYSCNLRCTYCFQQHSIHSKKEVMDVKQIEKAISDVETKILKKFNKDEYVISLFGGEPLQTKTYDVVEKVLILARQKGIFVNIITNGVELDKFLEMLDKYKRNISIQVTLDGIKEIHNTNRPGYGFNNSYDIISTNVSKALAKGLPIITRVNTTIESSKFLDEFIHECYANNWMAYSNFKLEIAPVTNHFNEKSGRKIYQESYVLDSIIKNSKVIEKLGNKISFTADMFRITGHIRCQFDNRLKYKINPTIRYCEATYLSTYAVGPDGYVYLCTDAIGREDLAAGSFYPELNLNEVYINQLKHRTVFEMEKCRHCNIAGFCGGGCPTAALKEYHDAGKCYCGNAKEVMADFLNKIK
ncbi:MAG: radical SAM protein [Faecalibacillus intestinalis]|uniref:radical SAM protein n=1 Tax=Coprobacillus cateniformis TaxID=100884 RepID=UPI0039A31F3C